MPAKFQLRKASTGKFRFVLLSTRGQVVATSDTYERKASALAGIRSLQKIAGEAAVEDTTTTQWAEAEAANKAAKKASVKKSGVKKSGAKKAAAKKVVTSSTKAAPKKAAPKKAGLRPVRQAPPSTSTPPEQLVPRI